MTFLLNHPRIEMTALSALKPNPNNPRRHADKQVERLVSSLRRFGWRGAILAEEDGLIVAGNGLFAAATRMGSLEVPVIRTSFLNEAERRAFVVAHNRLAELSEWDDDKLKIELDILFEQDGHLDGTGFDLSALDFSIGGEPAEEERVELPEPDAVAVSRLHDLWHLGPHRLYCGDARDPASYDALLGGDVAQIIFSDPPYNVPIDGHVGGNGRFAPRDFVMGKGEMSATEFTAFLRSVFRNCVRHATDGSLHLHCMDWRHLREILDASDGVYTEFKQLVVWAKPSGGQGAFLRSRHELILIFKSGRAKHTNNVLMGQSGRYRTNVVEYPGASGFYKGRDRDLADHSTIKPTALIADFLLDFSHRGDLVLDPFCGSAGAFQAAHKTHRRGAGIELDPVFVDTALRRLRDATGLIPTLADGRTFDEVAKERRKEATDV